MEAIYDGDYSDNEMGGDRENAAYYQPIMEDDQERALMTTDFNLMGQSVGMENLGNTCFMNAVLQALRLTPGFFLRLEQYDRLIVEMMRGAPSLSNDDAAKLLLVRALFRLFADAVNYEFCVETEDSTIVLDPSDLRETLIAVNCVFDGYDQHDAQEALSTILDAIDTTHRVVAAVLDDERHEIPEPLFDGRAAVTIQCCFCEQTSPIRHEPFTSLSIPLRRKGMKRKARSLEKEGNGSVSEDSESESATVEERPWMLETWSRPSMLSADDKYRCNVCRCLCEARQRAVIANPPSVLMFHLKRFATWSDFDDLDAQPRKICDRYDTPTFIPFEQLFQSSCKLSVNERANGAFEGEGYQLFGVVVHSGTRLGCGHYYSLMQLPIERIDDSSYQKPAPVFIPHAERKSDGTVDLGRALSGVWIKCDDDRVTQVDLADELNGYSASTYLLLYCRGEKVSMLDI
uniref:Ubiquitin carboxyl-terminal hydrolase n=1 Tax=Plectus sambesii TaxID=2011161 RepID=A0A914XF42_9BILA